MPTHQIYLREGQLSEPRRVSGRAYCTARCLTARGSLFGYRNSGASTPCRAKISKYFCGSATIFFAHPGQQM
jgi:hypothetical protein